MAMHEHGGYKPHSHEVRADHLGVRRYASSVTADGALDRIASLLEGHQGVLCEEIAAVLRITGRVIAGNAEPDDIACGQQDEAEQS